MKGHRLIIMSCVGLLSSLYAMEKDGDVPKRELHQLEKKYSGVLNEEWEKECDYSSTEQKQECRMDKIKKKLWLLPHVSAVGLSAKILWGTRLDIKLYHQFKSYCEKNKEEIFKRYSLENQWKRTLLIGNDNEFIFLYYFRLLATRCGIDPSQLLFSLDMYGAGEYSLNVSNYKLISLPPILYYIIIQAT